MTSFSCRRSMRSLFLACLCVVTPVDVVAGITGGGGRFHVIGPVVTVTLKDEDAEGHDSTTRKWMNFHQLRPNVLWSAQSKGPPLPESIPNLQSVRANVGYEHSSFHSKKSFLPLSFAEADLRFDFPQRNLSLNVQPAYEVQQGKASLMLQATRGANFVLTKVSTHGDRWLQGVKGCWQCRTKFPECQQVRISPTYDATKGGQFQLLAEGMTSTQRTKAVLNLNVDNPTLTVVHQLDDRNVIAPEISLYNAKICYQWHLALDAAGSMIRTTVDPSSQIHVTWTDATTKSNGGGKWVTDVKLPLEGTTISALAAQVRVRRQFSF